MTVQTARLAGRPQAMPWFGTGFVAVCAILIVFGFSFSFVAEVVARARPIWLYLHIAAAGAWIVLVIVQASLAMRRRFALHRRIGAWGFGLGVVSAITAFITALVLRHDSVIAHGEAGRAARIAFLAIPLNSAIVFSVLLACAWIWRHRPPAHRRCMLLATAALTLPAAARIPGLGELGPAVLLPTDLLILLLVGVDLWRERRVHLVYRIGAPGIVVLQLATFALFITHPAWWVRTASVLIGV